MEMIIANPLGYWFLLGIPAIIIIHLIQPKPVKLISSTIFFWKEEVATKTQARNISNLKYSLNLLLQLLSVLLLTYLAVEPRWLIKNSRQRIFVVLDNSFSMHAFLEEIPKILSVELKRFEKTADNTEWVLSETGEKPHLLYSGESLGKLLDKTKKWQPHLGEHNIFDALSLLKNDCAENCQMIFVSDHQQVLPQKVELFSLGKPLDNVGFISGVLKDSSLEVAIKNYSKVRQKRNYLVKIDNAASESKEIEILADNILRISFKLPNQYQKITLSLNRDQFGLDDYLPVVRETEKELKVYIRESLPFISFVNKLIKSLNTIKIVDYPEEADLLFLNKNSYEKYRNLIKPKIIFTEDLLDTKTLSYQPIFAELNYLTEDLSWQGLLLPQIEQSQFAENQQAILWQGDRALIVKESQKASSNLIIKFDLRQANARNFPSFIILLSRFIGSIRQEVKTMSQQNFELSQTVNLKVESAQTEVKIENLVSNKEEIQNLSSAQLNFFNTPSFPSFFEISAGKEKILIGSSQFYDLREADFKEAITKYDLSKVELELKELHSFPDQWEGFWVLLLICLVLGSWYTANKA